MATPHLNPCEESAIDWMLRLSSGRAAETDRQAFARWRTADPAHAAAWERLTAALSPFEPLAAGRRQDGQAQAICAALNTPNNIARNRRRLLKGTAALFVLGVGGYTTDRLMTADLHTDVAQRRAFTLDDNSLLTLNADSDVDIRFSAAARTLRLHKGALVVSVARDPARPFVVQTQEGAIQALGTRFLARQENGQTLVAVLEHSVLLTARDGKTHVLREGEVARMTAHAIHPVQGHDAQAEAAWMDGMLDVRNASLGEVIDTLRPYHRGWIRISPEAARLPVFGVFPLDRSDHALQALAETLPIRTRRFGPWLVMIEHQ